MANHQQRLGKVGLWAFNLDLVPYAQEKEILDEIVSLGFTTLWIPEAVGKEPIAHAALLLANSTTLKVATGIASIWARDAVAAAQAQQTLTEAFPDRFVLGLGVSHAPMVIGVRGQQYEKPYQMMVNYLDGMDRALYLGAQPAVAPQRVLGALGPRMLQLAATRGAGAHPYFVPVEHTAFAREVMGSDALLAPEQAVVFSRDPEQARTIARTHMATYLGLPNYCNNLLRFGFTADDIADGGSDRLVDAIVAWGDDEAIATRLRAHHDAGADHVAVQVLSERLTDPPPLEEWRRLGAIGASF